MSDFGLGKDLSIFNSHQTINTNSYGQYFYCDPRQFMKLKDGDKSSDIYSIGKVINFIFTKNPNDTNHQLKGVAEKATASSEVARYKTVEEIQKAITILQKFITSEMYEQEIIEKIKQKQIDESVIGYINTLSTEKLFVNLKDSYFNEVYLLYLKNYNDPQQQYNNLNELYDEMKIWKDKRVEDYDSIGYFAINIIKDDFDFSVKEAAIEMLNYIIELNRFDVMKEIKKMIDETIDPLLEDKLLTDKLKGY
jgi:serine/threonine protein kinase